MKKKIVVIAVIAFLMMPSFISANENAKAKTTMITQTQTYNLYKKTIIIFGIRRVIKDTFTTPPDCKKLMVSARVGPLFTGNAGIFIRSEGHRGDHTIWGTGWYILGQFVWPSLRVFYERWFTPGLQYVEIQTSDGFGIVTFWVNGSS